ncbi:MAG: arginine--tRNA ligase [Flavobacteriales bacterium]
MTFTIAQIITSATLKAAQELFQTELESSSIQLQQTRKEFEGDVTLVVFPLTKISKIGPEQTGQMIGEYLKKNCEDVKEFNVVKGFLNISMTTAFWLRFFNAVSKQEKFGFALPNTAGHIMVEYSSPNTNKPLHLGHLRNIFLGHSVSKILEACGHRVTRVQIINDRGIHICKSMTAWKKFGGGETPDSTGLKGDKLVGKYYVEFDKQYKREQKELIAQGVSEEDAAKQSPIMLEAQNMLRQWEDRDQDVMDLWKMMNGWVYSGFNATYEKMGVRFDKLYYESDTYLLGKEEVEKGLQSGVFFQKDDGSIWIDLTSEGLDEKALLRKDGTAMYITQDIGTAILRFREFPDLESQIYTVGNEQEYHFKVLFKILKHLGFSQADKCFHLSYGMVELPEGKMKSREGTVVDADDLMDEMTNVAREVAEEQGKLEGLEKSEKESLYESVGMAALKYFLLRVDPRKNMLFNPKESIDFNGSTGPFIQYTYVRTKAILRRVIETEGIESTFPFNDLALIPLLGDREITLLRKMYEWPEILKEAGKAYNPASIAHYCYELAREYNGYYHDNPIIREENKDMRNFRIQVTQAIGKLIGNSMNLLGASMPERM